MNNSIQKRCTLKLRGLQYEARIGFHDHEIKESQRIQVDVDIRLISKYMANVVDSELHTAYDYDQAYKVIAQIVNSNHFNLLEVLATAIGERIYEQDDRIESVMVKVSKPQAYTNGYSECEISIWGRG